MRAIQTTCIAFRRARPKFETIITETQMSFPPIFISVVLSVMGLFAVTLASVAIISRK